MTTKEIFTVEVDRLWIELKDRDDTIFENVAFQIDSNIKFEELKESHPETYMNLIQEDSVYEKKKNIRIHFWDNIVGELYENTLDIMKKANILEESLASFEKSYKIERTAELILENGIFARYPSSKKKELVETVIEQTFYPASFQEKHMSMLLNPVLEENWIKPTIQWGGERIRDVARLLKGVSTILTYALVSPASFTVGKLTATIGDKLMSKYDPATARSGIHPSLRKFYSFIDSFSPVNMLFKFLNKDLYEVTAYLRKANTLDDEYIQDILKEMKSDPNKLISKCWDKNKHQMSSSDPDNKKTIDYIGHLFNGRGIANMLRNPQTSNEDQIAQVLIRDAADPSYQKMFFDFRTCIYDKFFEVILGYAKAIYSMDDSSYEIIKAANDAHTNKNFKSFFDLRPKQDNEEAMFKIMRALVSIDSIATNLEKRKGELVADKYIDRFSTYLRQNIKQVYTELNEMANQKKFNEDRYNEDEPDEETKIKAIQQDRFNARKSIFDER